MAATQPPDPVKAAENVLAEDSIQLAKGGATVVTATILAQVLSMLTALWIARRLGPDEYGLLSLGMSVILPLATLAGLGLSQTVIRFIPVHLGNKDDAQLAGVISSSLVMATIASVLIAALTIGFAEPLANVVFDEPRLVPLLRVLALSVPLLVMTGTALAATRGSKNMVFDAIVQVAGPLFKLAAWVVGLLLVSNLLWAAVGANLFQWLMTAILALGFTYWLYKDRFGSGIQWSFRTLWVYSAPLILSSLMYSLAPRMDRLVLGVVGDTVEVGIYSLAASLVIILNLAHASIVKTFLPVIADAYNRVSVDRAKNLYIAVTRWDSRLTFAIVIVSILFAQEVMALLGEDYAAALLPFIILATSVYVGTIAGPTGAFLQMTNRQRVDALNAFVFFLLSPALQLGLALWLGWVGVAVGVLVAAILLNLVQFLEIRHLYGFHPFQQGHLLFSLLSCAVIILCAFAGLSQDLAVRIGLLALVATGFAMFIYFNRTPSDAFLFQYVRKRFSPGSVNKPSE